MNGVLKKFKKRNIQANFYHFILVIFVIAVSCCLITGLFISNITLNNAVTNFYKQSNLPNLWIETNFFSSEDEEFLSKYTYGKRYSFNANFKNLYDEHNAKFLVSNGKISIPYIEEGNKGNGCYVDSEFIEKYNIGINYSYISFDYTLNGVTQKLRLKVLGSFSMAEKLAKNEKCLIFIDENVFLNCLKTTFNLENAELSIIPYNQVLITSNITNLERQEINDYFNSKNNMVSMKNQEEIESFKIVKKELRISEFMAWTFPILFVIISILVVYSTINKLILREQYNIGLLKSLGISNKAILNNYSSYGIVVCLIGSLFGLLLAPLFVPNICFDCYDLIFNLPQDEVKMAFPILLALIILFVFELIGYFSAFYSIIKIVNKSPKECMSGVGKISLKTRKPRKNRFGIIGSSLKNMKINKSRTVMSIVGISGGLILTIIGFGVNFIYDNNNSLTINAFSNIFKGFSIILLLLMVLILSIQIFRERKKEFAMLRIHGKSYLKIWLTLLIEMVLIIFISYFISILFSQPTFILMQKIFGFADIYLINFMSYLKTFLVIFVIVIVISLFYIYKICKLSLAEEIKFSE